MRRDSFLSLLSGNCCQRRHREGLANPEGGRQQGAACVCVIGFSRHSFCRRLGFFTPILKPEARDAVAEISHMNGVGTVFICSVSRVGGGARGRRSGHTAGRRSTLIYLLAAPDACLGLVYKEAMAVW